MALPEFSPASADNAASLAPVPITAPLPHAALNRLPHLHAESRLALRRAGLLSRAVPAAGTLLAMGTVAALGGGGELGPTFAWSLLVLGGVTAILVSHLRTAAVFKDMAGSAADLRAILLYLGAAWGLGSFLALSPQAFVIVAFSAIPSLAMALLLRDGRATLSFCAPVTLLGLAACWLRTGDTNGTILLAALQAATAIFFWLRKRSRAGHAPPGLALR